MLAIRWHSHISELESVLSLSHDGSRDPCIFTYMNIKINLNWSQLHLGKYTVRPMDPSCFLFSISEVLRIGKLVRSIRMIRMTRVMVSLQMLIKCLLGSANTLLWSFSLLAGIAHPDLPFKHLVDGNNFGENQLREPVVYPIIYRVL